MSTTLYLVILFLAKVLDNTLGTAKTILVQRNRCILAGIASWLVEFHLPQHHKKYSNFGQQSRTCDSFHSKWCRLLFGCCFKQSLF